MDLTATELFLVDMVVILILARLCGVAARAVGQPPVVGEIIGGILLGPTLFSGKLSAWLFNGHPTCTIDGKVTPGVCPNPLPAGVHKAVPANAFDAVANPVTYGSNIGALTAISNIGLILFMFIVGYEVDRTLFKGRERVAVSVSLGSIVLPMIGGTFLGFWLYDRHPIIHQVSGIGRLPTALFVGAAMSVTAFPVLARILTDRGMHRTRLGGLSIASAAVDDIAAWTLLAVVVGIAGAEVSSNTAAHPDDAWHIYLAPAYLLVMFFLVRPLLRMVNQRYLKRGRLAPDQMSIVVVVVLLSSLTTEWLNVHFIFGAFIAGACMPRATGEALRVTILERLEQISVIVLLPVFFVISGVRVDLSTFSTKDLGELLAILGVAIGGKFLGAYLGARSVGVAGRQAGALAALMNTRGLTELIILNVGKSLGVLDTRLFSLMVVMAIVTTAMTGPILRVVYPKALIDRDIADAERAALKGEAAYRVLAVVNDLDDTDLVDAAIGLAASRSNAEVLLARMVPQKKADRLEVGSGLGVELLVMTQTLGTLHGLAARGAGTGVNVRVHAKFSDDVVADDLTALIIEVDPDLVVLDAETELAPHNFMPRIVRKRAPLPEVITSVAVLVGRGGADTAAAVQVAAALATSKGVELVVTGGGRADRIAADLAKHGINATTGDIMDGSVVVGSVDEAGRHLVARARPGEEADQIDEWAGSLSAPTPAGGDA
jgi:Kef-type K+ transport system membrane component KefB